MRELFDYPWEFAPSWALWAAMDMNGRVAWYSGEPSMFPSHVWYFPPGKTCVLGIAPSWWDLSKWEESLRPKENPK